MKININKKTVLIPFDEYETEKRDLNYHKKLSAVMGVTGVLLKRVAEKYNVTGLELTDMLEGLDFKIESMEFPMLHCPGENIKGILLIKK